MVEADKRVYAIEAKIRPKVEDIGMLLAKAEVVEAIWEGSGAHIDRDLDWRRGEKYAKTCWCTATDREHLLRRGSPPRMQATPHEGVAGRRPPSGPPARSPGAP
ncbi:MAG: hypothetical protein QXT27_07375 [Pyrobaculum sp.]